MKKFIIKFTCRDQDDVLIITAFPHATVEINKDSIKDAAEWFVEFIGPQFDRIVGKNGSWNMKVISVTEDGIDKTFEFQNILNEKSSI